MKKTVTIEKKEPLVMLSDTIVYSQKPAWCNATTRQLRLSFMRPRKWFSYDEEKKALPLLIFICGGGFEKVDTNVWMPELAYFAKQRYAVASIEYTVTPYAKITEYIEDVKQAIRFLRARADDFGVDPTRFAVMGESAGGYLAAMVGTCGDTKEFDKGDYLEQSSAVQLAIAWYPVVDVKQMAANKKLERLMDLANPVKYISAKTPPFLILHGNADSMAPYHQGEILYEALQKAGVESDLYAIEGADHADVHFGQPELKKIILDFLNKHFK